MTYNVSDGTLNLSQNWCDMTSLNTLLPMKACKLCKNIWNFWKSNLLWSQCYCNTSHSKF